MATMTLSSSSNTTKQLHSSAKTHQLIHLGDASFSSYISNVSKDIPMDSITNQQATPYQKRLGRASGDGEIGIFGAERYFKGGMDEKKTVITETWGRKSEPRKDEWRHLKSKKLDITPGTPSACSEASWTSRSALLPTVLNESYPTRTRNVSAKRFFTMFAYKCTCADQKSGNIKENVEEAQSISNCNTNADGGGIHGKEITKPTVGTNSDMTASVPIKQSRVGTQFQESALDQNFNKVNLDLQSSKCVAGVVTAGRQGEELEKEKPRISLEVFGSPIMEVGDRTWTHERRLRTLTWDVAPKVENIAAEEYEDAESDTSSDLFEIKTDYEATEVSIERSVVTARAVNFCTTSKLYEEKSVLKSERKMFHKKSRSSEKKVIRTRKTDTRKEVSPRHSSGMWGCKSKAAVKVAEDPYNRETCNKKGHQTSGSLAPRGMHNTETKLTDFLSAHPRSAAASAPTSKSFYIH